MYCIGFDIFVEKTYNNAPASITCMNIMMNPVLGKEFFELVSLAVSAVNGWMKCVKSHEQSVLQSEVLKAEYGMLFEFFRYRNQFGKSGVLK